MVYTCIGCRTTRRIPAPPTLAADVPMDAPLSHVSTSTSLPVTKPPNSDPTSVTAMDVITAVGDLQPSGNSSGQVRSRKKAAVHRRPPLFVRDVGHVVFCGNERLDNMGAERGDGIYIT
jgi:ribonuclease P protein subunit RPR2